MPALDRRWTYAFAVVALLLLGADVVLGSCNGLLHLLPFALLLFPLLRGRYVCERYLTRTAKTLRPRRATTPALAPPTAGHHRLARGSELLGSGFARRPPPLRPI